MSGLADLDLHTAYHRGRDDIANDFYLPAMARAIEYDRAVGFFRSSAFIIAWPGLRDFVARGGRMRVLCSQILASEDADALDAGYGARADERLEAAFAQQVKALLADAELGEPTRILAALVATGVLEFKIALLRPGDAGNAKARIFHDKLGVFRDGQGNVVIFKGSMNETWSGLSGDGNLESVDVAGSWLGSRDLERTSVEQSYFADLWADRYPGVRVRPFPELAKEELVRAAVRDWEGSLDDLLGKGTEPSPVVADIKGRTLYDHQERALLAWQTNGRHGIFQLATGAGKTLTAMIAVRDAIENHGEVPVIVVPGDTLFDQWLRDEVKPFCSALGVQLLRVGAGNNRWPEVLNAFTRPGPGARLVLASLRTAAGEPFRQRICGGEHLFLVADEVHRFGSPEGRKLLDPALFGPRLGLSATPKRAGDPTGTAAILDFFGGILQPAYSLRDAINDKRLTGYFYYPQTVFLNQQEERQWQVLSARIAKLRAQQGDGFDADLDRRISLLQFDRARVVKGASAKVPLAVAVLKAAHKPGQRWIVYCDDLDQLNAVSGALESAGIVNLPYHSKMAGDRTETLRWLELQGGVVVAIKCLDEGVDIPAVSHALILASSKNPREFIQRRGRVLRRAPDKPLAFVYDAIVMPSHHDPSGREDPIASGELARAIEFAQGAQNPGAMSDLERIAIDAGIDWRSALEWGVEDADE